MGIDGAPSASDGLAVVERVEAIIGQQLAFDEQIGAMFGVALLRATTSSNQFFDVYQWSGTGIVRSVEVRSPTILARRSPTCTCHGMVLIELEDGSLTAHEIGPRFGTKQPGPRSIPNPGPPLSATTRYNPLAAAALLARPCYDTYAHSWGKVSLGYTPLSGCLVSIVLEKCGNANG